MTTTEYITAEQSVREAHDFIALRGLELAFEANLAFNRRENHENGICHFNMTVNATGLLVGRDSEGEHSPLITSPSQAVLFTANNI